MEHECGPRRLDREALGRVTGGAFVDDARWLELVARGAVRRGTADPEAAQDVRRPEVRHRPGGLPLDDWRPDLHPRLEGCEHVHVLGSVLRPVEGRLDRGRHRVAEERGARRQRGGCLDRLSAGSGGRASASAPEPDDEDDDERGRGDDAPEDHGHEDAGRELHVTLAPGDGCGAGRSTRETTRVPRRDRRRTRGPGLCPDRAASRETMRVAARSPPCARRPPCA